jgi:hypothetical protein
VERFHAAFNWLIDPNNLTAISTLAIALFTIVLAAVGYGQARLIRKSIDLGRQEFIATHRPRIIVRFVQGPFDDGQEPEFVWVTVANVGETPATIIAMGHDLARRKGRNNWLPPGVAAALRDISPSVLESGDRLTIKVSAQNVTDDAAIAAGVWDDVELCAVGQIRYRDGNGRRLAMAFLRVHDGQGNFIPSDNPEDEYQD